MEILVSKNIIKESGIQFGTSGARGLVTKFTSNVCAAFIHAFITSIQNQFNFNKVAIAIDNRPSSAVMAQACAKAIQQLGFDVIYYGVVPTPALAYVSMQDNIPCIMVTGSHIPFDRNGLKFYRPDGEISKTDEQAILNATTEFEEITDLPELIISNKAAVQYMDRYISLFDSQMLAGKRIGIYEHSSAGRDLYALMFEALGAEVIALERSDKFVPIDTEAVSEADKQKAKRWSKEHNLDFIFSTDGDGDRPLVADENGVWLRGDILGLLCADAMNVEALAVPVSCNTAIEICQRFNFVVRTKIGSPYVIDAFNMLSKKYQSFAGLEANGGFLLGSDTLVNTKLIKALPTRDAVLPALMLLMKAKDKSISELVSSLPQRFTYSDRIQNFPVDKSFEVINKAQENPYILLDSNIIKDHYVTSTDLTDGLRVSISNGDIIHLRPSGNAPEIRCYSESSCMDTAQSIVNYVLNNI